MNCHHVVAETSPPRTPWKKIALGDVFCWGPSCEFTWTYESPTFGTRPNAIRSKMSLQDWRCFFVSCFCCDSFFHFTWAQQTGQRNFTFATNCSTRCVMFRHPVRCDDQTPKSGFCRCSNRNSRNICVLQFAHGVGELLFSWQSLHTNNSIYPRRQKAICN